MSFHGNIKYTEYTTIQRLTDMTVHDFRWKDSTERVLEVGHPLCRQCFVTPILAGFFCDALQPLTRGNFQQCVWEEVYYLLNERLHADLFQVSERLANAWNLLGSGNVTEVRPKSRILYSQAVVYIGTGDYHPGYAFWGLLGRSNSFQHFLVTFILSRRHVLCLAKTMNSFPTLIEKFQKAEFIQLSHSAGLYDHEVQSGCDSPFGHSYLQDSW